MRLKQDWDIGPLEAAEMTPNQIAYLLLSEEVLAADKARLPQTPEEVAAYVAAYRAAKGTAQER